MNLRDDREMAIYEAGYLDACHDLRRAVGEAQTPGRIKKMMAATVHQRIFGQGRSEEEAAKMQKEVPF